MSFEKTKTDFAAKSLCLSCFSGVCRRLSACFHEKEFLYVFGSNVRKFFAPATPCADDRSDQLKQVVEAALRSLQPQAQGQDMQVHSGSFGVYPRQDDQGKIKGWQGRAEVVLEGRDFARISQAAAQVQDMAVSSMGFGLSRGGRQKVLEQAQADAIGQFKQRASFLAKQFGFSGYTLREVNVNTQDGFYAPRMQRAGLVMAVAEKADMASPVPVEAGKEQVTVQVSGSIQLH